MTTTLGAVLARHEQDVLDHLDRQSTVPVVTFGRQGDVIVVPERLARVRPDLDPVPVPPEGVAVVRGESGGNTHLLVAEGDVRFGPTTAGAEPALDLGVLEVRDGATAYLIHPEHGAVGFAPGRYTVSRQREFDGEALRVVVD